MAPSAWLGSDSKYGMNLYKPGTPAMEQVAPRDTPETQIIPECFLERADGAIGTLWKLAERGQSGLR
jgi:hypothetical protein